MMLPTHFLNQNMHTGITKIAPESQRLFKDDRVMEDNRCLADYGLISTTARAQSPASLSLAYR
jgi:transcription elongation factor B subunit 2